MTDPITEWVPSLGEADGIAIYFIPYNFSAVIGPEALWNDNKVSYF